jgi:hypothetical protein
MNTTISATHMPMLQGMPIGEAGAGACRGHRHDDAQQRVALADDAVVLERKARAVDLRRDSRTSRVSVIDEWTGPGGRGGTGQSGDEGRPDQVGPRRARALARMRGPASTAPACRSSSSPTAAASTGAKPVQVRPCCSIHGLGSSGADWAFQVPALADRYRLLMPDLRGSGRSDRPPGHLPHRVAGGRSVGAARRRGRGAGAHRRLLARWRGGARNGAAAPATRSTASC